VIAGLRVLGLIPARGGSKGVPGKNLRDVAGKPLIAWTIEAAAASKYVDRQVISSDDSRIIEEAKRYGCEAPFVRPAKYAQDDSPGIDPVLHALAVLPGFDIVVLLQPTSPLRTAADIDTCLERLVETGAASCVSVREASDHPYWTFWAREDSRLSRFVNETAVSSAPRQALPRALCLNGAVYAARVPQLLSSRALIGNDTIAYEMPLSRSLDIDDMEDLVEADRALSGLVR
jgi:CMP-N,N'-diacetyllegionaminic acid synthase